PQVKLAADILARLIHRQSPATTTLDSRPGKRQGRIYLDTTRNARGQAVAVAYCARPHPAATVSAPLKWSEVRRGLDYPAAGDSPLTLPWPWRLRARRRRHRRACPVRSWRVGGWRTADCRDRQAAGGPFGRRGRARDSAARAGMAGLAPARSSRRCV